jgi:hypothetical protein
MNLARGVAKAAQYWCLCFGTPAHGSQFLSGGFVMISYYAPYKEDDSFVGNYLVLIHLKKKKEEEKKRCH